MPCGCDEKNGRKVFYEYELKVYDLSPSTLIKNDNRVLYKTAGGMELSSGSSFRDAVLLRHGVSLSAYGDKDNIKVVVNTIRSEEIHE